MGDPKLAEDIKVWLDYNRAFFAKGPLLLLKDLDPIPQVAGPGILLS